MPYRPIKKLFTEELNEVKLLEKGAPVKNYTYYVKSTNDYVVPTYINYVGKDAPTIIYHNGGPHSELNVNDLEFFAKMAACNVVSFAFRGTILEESVINAAGMSKATYEQCYNEVDFDYGGSHMDDLRQVLSFIKGNEDFRIDDQKIWLIGSSFGGYSTLMAALDKDISESIKGFIAQSGFYRIPTEYEMNLKSNLDEAQKDLRQKPIDYTSAIDKSKPFFIIHGGEGDVTTLVNLEDALELNEKLSIAGIEGSIIDIVDSGHGDLDIIPPIICKGLLGDAFNSDFGIE